LARGIIVGIRAVLNYLSYRGSLAGGRVRLVDPAVLQQVMSQIVQG
jgi:hypothetical protein